MTENNHKIYIRNWLYLNAFMVFCMAIIGAITRLTESGLSIVEWQPITGIIPPLNAAEWAHMFDLYQQTPQYQKITTGMSLDEFKQIFFWEWFHRLWGRMIGVVYALPLVFFWVKGWIPNGYKAPLFGLFILGGLQGVIGYIMVLSGLVDSPSVSHYRLALHLGMAFALYSCLLWAAFSLSNLRPKHGFFCLRRHGYITFGLFVLTLIWGAFMAGKDAGLVTDQWPMMMDGHFAPYPLLPLSPSWMNIFDYEMMIHFVHRWMAAITAIMVLAFAWRVKSWPLAMIVLAQFALGILTVMTHVQTHVAATHQAGAFILGGLLLRELYKIRKTT